MQFFNTFSFKFPVRLTVKSMLSQLCCQRIKNFLTKMSTPNWKVTLDRNLHSSVTNPWNLRYKMFYFSSLCRHPGFPEWRQDLSGATWRGVHHQALHRLQPACPPRQHTAPTAILFKDRLCFYICKNPPHLFLIIKLYIDSSQPVPLGNTPPHPPSWIWSLKAFFHESNPPGPLINWLKWFCWKIRFRGDIPRKLEKLDSTQC